MIYGVSGWGHLMSYWSGKGIGFNEGIFFKGVCLLYILQKCLKNPIHTHTPQCLITRSSVVSSLLPPATQLPQGNVYTPVCQSFCSRGGIHGTHAPPPPTGHTCPPFPPDTTRCSQWAAGKHPTGMHSCWNIFSLGKKIYTAFILHFGFLQIFSATFLDFIESKNWKGKIQQV